VSFEHLTVLRDESVAALAPAAGETFVDCTLGGGGHTEALLEAAECRVIGLDRDPAALSAARERLARFGDRFEAVHTDFAGLSRVLAERGLSQVDGVLADLGVSSPQLDEAERGFSFRMAGPVDMRMDPTSGITAAELLATVDEAELVRILRDYGEERHARRVARALLQDQPFTDTVALAECVARVVGRGKGRIHPATRTFQALRIAVNGELDQLESLLQQAHDHLAPGGRLAFITFHSLEDRLVKQFLHRAAGRGLPRDAYGNPIGDVTLQLARPLTPSPDDPNPRARSSRLRSAQRLPWNAP
jgi:16S rRNA (cytosine1402-N4)-methyltransferase